MGWKDQSTPVSQDTPAPVQAAPAPTSGWQTQSTPANAPPPVVVAAPPPDNSAVIAKSALPESWTKKGLERDPNWKPTGNWIHDIGTYPLAKSEDPITAAYDAGLSTYDAATFGYGVPTALKDRVAQANENLGVVGYGTQGIGYALGPGKVLGPMARGVTRLAAPAVAEVGAPLAARIGGSMAAGGLEGAGAGGLGAAGHGGDTSDITRGIITGGLTGAAGGAAGGSGPKPKVPEVGVAGTGTTPATGMYANKATEYAPLDNIYFDNKTAIRAANQGLAKIKAARDPANLGANAGLTPEINKIVNRVVGDPVVTGRGFQEASRDLRSLDNGNNIQAHRIADQFDEVLKTGTPIRGGAPGSASVAKDLGDLWHGRIRDLETLGDAPTAANVKSVQGWHPDASTPQAQALADLAKAQKPSVSATLVRHAAAPLAGAAIGAAEGAFNADKSASPWMNALIHGAVGAGLGKGVHLASSPNSLAALNAARYAIATGQPLTTATGRTGDAIKSLMLGGIGY